VSTVRIRRPYNALIGAVLVAALSAGLASVAPAQTTAPYVRIFVDGSPVTLSRPPVIVNGRMLVPMRSVFQQLGATVTWDPLAETALAQRGGTTVSLSIGAMQGFVNGQAQVLDVPPMIIGGQTMVPLSFISQALGAAVAWNPAASVVQITSHGAAAAPATPAVPGVAPVQAVPGLPPAPTTVTGTVVSVTASPAPGQLVVRTPAGQTYTYSIAPGTAVTRTAPVQLSDVQPGDTVQVTADQNGTAQVVHAASPATTALAVPAAAVTVTVAPAARPLGAGDLLTVTATGPPQATATFAIPGLRTGLLMSESPTQPGTYVGYYTIRPGDRVTGTTVVVTMTAPNGQVVTANAPVSVTVNSAAPVAPGAAVITSPAPASVVGTPFTVTGTAPPGSLVRVQADYVGGLLFFNVHGTLGTQVVTADANGNWSATFTQASPMHGADLTISAAVVDNMGGARSPSMTIHTTIQ
jgi:Copper amine oxidase N-terminal domain